LEEAQAVQYLWPEDSRTKPLLEKARTADAKGPDLQNRDKKTNSEN